MVQKNVSHFFFARVWEMCTVEVPEKKCVRDIFHYNIKWFRRTALQTIPHNTINNLVCSHIIWPSFPQSHLKHTMHSFFSKLIIDISLHLIAMTSAPWNFYSSLVPTCFEFLYHAHHKHLHWHKTAVAHAMQLFEHIPAHRIASPHIFFLEQPWFCSTIHLKFHEHACSNIEPKNLNDLVSPCPWQPASSRITDIKTPPITTIKIACLDINFNNSSFYK